MESESLATVAPGKHRDLVPARSSFDQDHLPEEFDKVCATIEKMRDEFDELKEIAFNKLVMLNIKSSEEFTRFKRKLSFSTPQPHYEKFLAEVLSHTTGNDFTDIKKVFRSMSEFWYILDIGLLDRVIRFISPETVDQLERYNKMLEEIEKQCIAFVAKALQKLDIHPNTPKNTDYSLIIEKLDWDPYKYTVGDLIELRKTKLQQKLRKLSLTKSLMLLYDVALNCVVVTWLVPSYDVEWICKILEQFVADGIYFKENNVISIELNNCTFLPMEMDLFQATECNDVKKVDLLLEKWSKHHNINKTNKKGETNLIVASKLGYSGVVALLLEEESIDINYQMETTFRTALFFAREGRHCRTVKLLEEYGADRKLKDKDGNTAEEAFPEALHEESCDIRKKSTKLWELFNPFVQKLYSKFKPKWEMFEWCLKGDCDRVSTALKSLDSDSMKKTDNERNWTPLMWACYGGHYDIVKLLVHHDKDSVAVKSIRKSWTPLLIAACQNHLRIAKFLLKHNGDPNDIIDPNESHFSALMFISDLKYWEVARTLLKHGANVDIPDKLEATPLFRAISAEDEVMVRLFLEYDANVNVQAEKGWSPLMEAARTNNEIIFNLLLESGATVTLEMKDAGRVTGETALHVACYYGADDIVKTLVRCDGINANKENEAGFTPLMIAIKQQNQETVRTLAQCRSVDVNCKHKNYGISPLTLAVLTGNMEICEILLQNNATAEECVWDFLPTSWKNISEDFLEKFKTAVPHPAVKLMESLWKEYTTAHNKRN